MRMGSPKEGGERTWRGYKFANLECEA
jgi:hypothetical protein